LKSASDRAGSLAEAPGRSGRRALVARIGALGDILLTRRLTFSLSLAGLRSTLFAPSRHASVLLADPWIDAVLDSESPRFAEAFIGSWPDEGGFEAAIVISDSRDLEAAGRRAAGRVLRLSPVPVRDDTPIFKQWTRGASTLFPPVEHTLPILPTNAAEALVSGATLIHPGSGSPQKNWSVERFVELGKRLEALGHQVAWILGPAEAGFASALPGRIIDRPSLPALAATLARSRLFVGNDSGVSHLAAATGAPTLVLFGPTSASVWRPDGRRVGIVQARSGAFADLQVDEVVAASVNLADWGSGEE
jgi:ADP-heptose:LPS heptosyltransferase